MKLQLFLIAILSCYNVFAVNLDENFKGFVQIQKKELYVDYSAPEKGKPTVILLNGLTYSTVQWNDMTTELKKFGLGVLRYDMDGMGETLLKYGPKNEPYSYQDQVTDLDQLLTKLKIQKPYNIVGLSYGGGIAGAYAQTFPKKVGHAILMAPYTEALASQDLMIKSMVASAQFYTTLFDKMSYDEVYDYYLRQIVFTTYPQSEPIVLENPYKLEAVFRMTQGIRKLKLLDNANKFPEKSIHLVLAQFDQYIPKYTLDYFWNHVPASAQASYHIIPYSEHKIPESRPALAAELVNDLIK